MFEWKLFENESTFWNRCFLGDDDIINFGMIFFWKWKHILKLSKLKKSNSWSDSWSEIFWEGGRLYFWKNKRMQLASWVCSMFKLLSHLIANLYLISCSLVVIKVFAVLLPSNIYSAVSTWPNSMIMLPKFVISL